MRTLERIYRAWFAVMMVVYAAAAVYALYAWYSTP